MLGCGLEQNLVKLVEIFRQIFSSSFYSLPYCAVLTCFYKAMAVSHTVIRLSSHLKEVVRGFTCIYNVEAETNSYSVALMDYRLSKTLRTLNEILPFKMLTLNC